MRIIVYSVIFNLYWFAALFFRQDAQIYLAIALFAFFSFKPNILPIAALIALIGIAVDQALTYEGILIFQTASIPLWLCMLWFAFAAYLKLVQSWLLSLSLWVLIPCAAIGGGLSYLAGQKIGAVQFLYSDGQTFGIFFVIWILYALAFPAILKHAAEEQFDKF